MAGKGGKPKVAKNRGKKTSKVGRKLKAEAQVNQKEGTATTPTEVNNIAHNEFVTQKQLQDAGGEMANAILFSDSEISSNGAYPSSPPVSSYNPYPRYFTNENHNRSQDDLALSGAENDQNAKTAIGTMKAGSKKSSYPTLVKEYATERLGLSMAPPPSAYFLVPQSFAQQLNKPMNHAYAGAVGVEGEFELLKSNILSPSARRPLPMRPITAVNDTIAAMDEAQAANYFDEVIDQTIGVNANVDLEKQRGDADINMFAAAKARQMQEREIQMEEEYDPEQLNIEELEEIQRNITSFMPNDKMDYTMGDGQHNESPPRSGNNYKRTPTTSEVNQSHAGSPHSLIVACPDKKAAEEVQGHVCDAAVGHQIISVVSASAHQNEKENSGLFKVPSNKMATELNVNRYICNGMPELNLPKGLVHNTLKSHVKGDLSKPGQGSVPFKPPNNEQVASQKNCSTTGKGPLRGNRVSKDKGKVYQPVHDESSVNWPDNAIQHDLDNKANNANKPYPFVVGDTLVAINDKELIDLDEGEVLKPKKKSNKKRRKAKKTLVESASQSAAGHDVVHNSNEEQAEIKGSNPTNSQAAMAEFMRDTAIRVVTTSKKGIAPQTLGQMRDEERREAKQVEFVQKCASKLGKDNLQALIDNLNLPGDDLRELAARNLSGPAASLDTDKLQKIMQNFTPDQVGAFLEGHKAALVLDTLSRIGDGRTEEGCRELLGQVDPKDVANFGQMTLESKAEALFRTMPQRGPAGEFLKLGVRIASEMENEGDSADPQLEALTTQMEASQNMHGIYKTDELMKVLQITKNDKKPDQEVGVDLSHLISLLERRIEQIEKAVEQWQQAVQHVTGRSDVMAKMLTTQAGKVADVAFQGRSHNTRLMVVEEAHHLSGHGLPSPAGEDADSVRRSAASHMDSQYRSFKAETESIRQYVDDRLDVLDDSIKELENKFRRHVKDHQASDSKLQEFIGAISTFSHNYEFTQDQVIRLSKDLTVLNNRVSDSDLRLQAAQAALESFKLQEVASGVDDGAPVKVSKLDSPVTGLAVTIDTVQRTLHEVSHKLNAEVGKHGQALTTIRADIAGLQKTTKATKIAVEDHSQEFASLSQATEQSDGGLPTVATKIATTLNTVSSTKAQVTRAIAEQNTIRNSVTELAAKAVTKEELNAVISGVSRYVDDTVNKLRRQVNNNATEKFGNWYGQVERDMQIHDAQFQKLESDLKKNDGKIAKIEKRLTGDEAMIRSNTNRLDTTNSQVNKLWGGFEREVGPVERTANDEESVNSTRSAQIADLVDKVARFEALTKPKAPKKKSQRKLLTQKAKVEADEKAVNAKAPTRHASNSKSLAATRSMLVHAASQTDILDAAVSSNDRLVTIPLPHGEQAGDLRVPRVCIPQLDRVMSEGVPITPGAQSPAPMIPHPTPPGSASLSGPIQCQPPPMMAIHPQGLASPALGQQQVPTSVSSQPVCGSPTPGMAMDRVMQAPPGAFTAPALANNLPVPTTGTGGPPPDLILVGNAFVPARNFSLPSSLALTANRSPPPAYQPNADPAQTFQNAVAHDVWNLQARVNEVANAVGFFQDQHRQLRMDVRYEIGVDVGRIEHAVNERFGRLGESISTIEEKQKVTQSVMVEMMRRLGMVPPPGFAQ